MSGRWIVLCTALLAIVLLPLAITADATTSEVWVGSGGGACATASLVTAIANASTAAGDMTVIRVVSNQDYSGLNLSLLNRNIALYGGFEHCADTIPGPVPTTISGAVGGGSVLLIASSGGARTVSLRDLVITGGTGDGDGYGGGAQIGGNISVEMSGVWLLSNAATFGGAISIVGGGGSRPSLDIHAGGNVGNSTSDGNTAVSGAGIYCQNADLALGEVNIFANAAAGSGGGLYLDGCTLTSSGFVYEETSIQGNSAVNGGGLYATGDSDIELGGGSSGGARSYFGGNTASALGGAAFVSGSDTRVRLHAAWMANNEAGQFGGAVFATQFGSFTLDRGARPELCPFFPCAAMLSNLAGVSGSAAYTTNGGSVRVESAEIRNAGFAMSGAVLHSSGMSGVLLINTLLDHMAGEGVVLEDGAIGHFQGVTFVADDFTSDFRLAGSGSELDIEDSIVWDSPAVVVAGAANGSVTAVNNDVHDASTLPGSVSVDPGFVDADSRNYRLRIDSPNVDTRTPDVYVTGEDPDGNPRPYDLPPDNGGIFDRGAFELGDRIFADGFDG